MRLFKSVLAALLLISALPGWAGEREAVALERIANGALLIDVRSNDEFAGGHLEGASNIPHPQIVDTLLAQGVAKDRPIVVYCRSGNRSGIAEKMLREAGFSDVHNGGGLRDLERQAAH